MAYQIIDEPETSTLSHLVVQPVWPLFALMFGGVWLAFPWFVFNGFALGCPHRKQTLLVAIGAVVGSAILVFGILNLGDTFQWDIWSLRYALSFLLIWKLGMGYWLFAIQSRSFQLYQYFGGIARNGLIVVFVAYLLRGRIIDLLPDFLLITLI